VVCRRKGLCLTRTKMETHRLVPGLSIKISSLNHGTIDGSVRFKSLHAWYVTQLDVDIILGHQGLWPFSENYAIWYRHDSHCLDLQPTM